MQPYSGNSASIMKYSGISRTPLRRIETVIDSFAFAHRLKFDYQRVAKAHQRHCKHHPAQEGCRVFHRYLVFDKQRCQSRRKNFIYHNAKKRK